jgi:hypothetical protein
VSSIESRLMAILRATKRISKESFKEPPLDRAERVFAMMEEVNSLLVEMREAPPEGWWNTRRGFDAPSSEAMRWQAIDRALCRTRDTLGDIFDQVIAAYDRSVR